MCGRRGVSVRRPRPVRGDCGLPPASSLHPRDHAVENGIPAHEMIVPAAVADMSVAASYRGRNSTFRDSMSVPQLVFLPRPPIAGKAGIFTPRWTIKAS